MKCIELVRIWDGGGLNQEIQYQALSGVNESLIWTWDARHTYFCSEWDLNMESVVDLTLVLGWGMTFIFFLMITTFIISLFLD